MRRRGPFGAPQIRLPSANAMRYIGLMDNVTRLQGLAAHMEMIGSWGMAELARKWALRAAKEQAYAEIDRQVFEALAAQKAKS